MGPSGQEEAQGVLPMLAVKSRGSRMTLAHVLERNGLVDSTVRRLVADLDLFGLRRLVFKSDQEPAILALKQAVRESMPTVEFVMEESLVEEHQSNGTIEVTVREVQKRIRVVKSALEERVKCEVLSRHPILAFPVEHVERLMSRYQVGRDGRTAYDCMLVSRTADSWLNLENECTSCQFDLEVQDKLNWIPSGKMVYSSASEIAVMRC